MVKIKKSPIPFNEVSYRNFIKKYNVEFPNAYLEFLKEHNGGIPEDNIVDLDEESFFITEFIGFDLEGDSDFNEIILRYWDDLPRDYYPIAHVDGGNLLLIHLHSNARGTIYLWDHEFVYPENLFYVSGNFSKLLNMVQPYNPEEEDLEDYEIESRNMSPKLLEMINDYNKEKNTK